MNRRARATLVASVLTVVLPLALPGPVDATSVDDQRREVERIVDELDSLHEQADILAEDYVVALDDQRRLDAEVVDAEARVAAKQAEVDALRGQLSAVAVRSFTGTGTDVLGPLFSNAGAYNDALSRDQYARVALSAGTATTDDLDEALASLHDERAILDDKRSEAEALTERIADAKQATDDRMAEYEERRAEAEAELGELIQKEEQRRIAAAQRDMEARVAAARSAERARPAAPAADTGDDGDSGTGGGRGGGGGDDGASDGGGGGASAPAPASVSNYPAPSSLAQTAINAALGQQGVPYRFAASSPGEAFDCSGLTMWAWGQAGVGLPHQSRAQAGMLPHVPVEAAQPGDLIFYYSPISHVGIYLGGGQLIHAPATGKTVSVASVNWSKVAVVGRPG
jgi:cell wall-associated NlpC family hydrolase